MNAVEFQHVTKQRKDFMIDDLTMAIPKGFITGFIGPNGSGKTTTIQMLMDIVQLDEGDIQIFGTSHKNHTNKQHIGFVYDDLYMYEEFTIKKMKSIIAPLYHAWDDELFAAYLAKFDLPYKKKIKKFSKGMKMKCSLLFALSHRPELIIMDEPTAGLDPIFRRELLSLLQELMVNEAQTILISTHITSDLDQISDYLILMNKGKIILQKSLEEIHEQYTLVKGKTELLDADTRNLFISLEESDTGFTALFKGDTRLFEEFELVIEKVTLEDLMYFLIKEDEANAANFKT